MSIKIHFFKGSLLYDLKCFNGGKHHLYFFTNFSYKSIIVKINADSYSR